MKRICHSIAYIPISWNLKFELCLTVYFEKIFWTPVFMIHLSKVDQNMQELELGDTKARLFFLCVQLFLTALQSPI